MADLRQYTVHAFTREVFAGNPAAVCIMDEWIDDALMARIAKENRLSETAFAVGGGGRYRLRWFTPGGEIDLCGHATLATAAAVLRFYEQGASRIAFETLSGELVVTRADDDLLEMDFPVYDLSPAPVTDAMERALGARPVEAWMGRDLMCVLGSEEEVRDLAPDLDAIAALDGLLVHVTARGREHDCVSRTFAPKLAVDEDPVCGSGHCHIAPYWARTLGKDRLRCWQASERGGEIVCTMRGDRVALAGRTTLFAESVIHI
ncbi:PhzF family phenazine biosynthesis protein [Actinomyces slackii]|uniref:Uncharacterized isomerase yddE n=1 Tax=Actinomyces slackii TaxID=52774 RepID=A0A448KC47_9ACTO|nr:PhzF family phenazine biosynthesis protein [Actinomyces slackii]VEG74514.1 Uncharacterized isomerase yddE [Actinomyces slackii]